MYSVDYEIRKKDLEPINGAEPTNIACKAVALEDGNVVAGTLFLKDDEAFIKPTLISSMLIPVHYNSVCFCSRRKDKDGIVIYENDILENEYGKKFIVKAKPLYDDDAWLFYYVPACAKLPCFKRYKMRGMTIIGNAKIQLFMED